jgi:hypothetical protein
MERRLKGQKRKRDAFCVAVAGLSGAPVYSERINTGPFASISTSQHKVRTAARLFQHS